MIDLYAAGTSNGIRARIALEECGLAYKLHPIALEKGENKTPQFMALNPNAQIPVIVDHEGPGGKPVTVSQSSAILVYAAEKSGWFIPKDGDSWSSKFHKGPYIYSNDINRGFDVYRIVPD